MKLSCALVTNVESPAARRGGGTPWLPPGVALRLAGDHIRRVDGVGVGRRANVHHRSRSGCARAEPASPDDQRRRDRHPRRPRARPGGRGCRLGVHRSIHPGQAAAAMGVRRGVRHGAAGAAARRDRPVGGRRRSACCRPTDSWPNGPSTSKCSSEPTARRAPRSPNGWATGCSRPGCRTAAAAGRPYALLQFGTVLDDGEDVRSEQVIASGRTRSGRGDPRPVRAQRRRGRRARYPAAPNGWRRSRPFRRPSVTSSPTKATWCGSRRWTRRRWHWRPTCCRSSPSAGRPRNCANGPPSTKQAGVTELVYQPAGPDVAGELARMMAAVG